jgi:predicted nucleic acid-binding protein
MSWLLDTNVLLRLLDAQSPEHAVAEATVHRLIAGGESVFISTQVLVEFWAVATRPEAVNGLGWSTETAADAVRALRELFPLLNETPDALDRWFELVNRFQVAGKHPHDARLAALLLAHGVRRILTFNTADFPFAWGVEAIHPSDLAETRPPSVT